MSTCAGAATLTWNIRTRTTELYTVDLAPGVSATAPLLAIDGKVTNTSVMDGVAFAPSTSLPMLAMSLEWVAPARDSAGGSKGCNVNSFELTHCNQQGYGCNFNPWPCQTSSRNKKCSMQHPEFPVLPLSFDMVFTHTQKRLV